MNIPDTNYIPFIKMLQWKYFISKFCYIQQLYPVDGYASSLPNCPSVAVESNSKIIESVMLFK